MLKHVRARRHRHPLILSASVFALCNANSLGQVVLDGTLGAAGPLAGPNFQVTADKGTKVGGNLFHSFSTFNLAAGESATFSGPSDVARVLTRVTGGAASNIDGTLRCTIPNADFYYVNPAGVVFGPNASLDVRGSFVVTTADVIKLADGGRFDAALQGESMLTTAAPAAFGFLAPAPGPIAVEGLSGFDEETFEPVFAPDLKPAPGKSLAIIAGDVRVVGGRLSTAGGGRLGVATAAPQTDVMLDPDGVPAVSTAARAGTVEIVAEGMLDAGTGGLRVATGSLIVSGGTLETTASDFDAEVPVAAGAVRIVAGSVTVDGETSAIRSQSFGFGDAGDVEVSAAGAITVSNGGFISRSGGAGVLRVTGDTVSLAGGSVGSSSDAPDVPPGDVEITATGALLLTNDSRVSSEFSGHPGPPLPGEPSEPEITGGAVRASAGSISMREFSNISGASVDLSATGAVEVSNAFVQTFGGPLKLSGESVAIRDEGSVRAIWGPAEVSAVNAVEIGAAGALGGGELATEGGMPLRVSGRSVTVRGGGRIATDGFDVAGAGPIEVVATDLVEVTGDGSRIIADATVGGGAEVRGPAGSVRVSGARVVLGSGGHIKSLTSEPAAGGVEVIGNLVTLDGTGASSPYSAIFSVSDGPGAGANVTVAAGRLELRGRAAVGAGRFAEGPAGAVDLSGVGELIDGRPPAPAADGTFGAAGPLAGPSFTVPPGSVAMADGNLFLSFAELNLAPFETLDVDVPADVGRVFVRVTGLNATTLDGRVRLAGAPADLFLMNPGGLFIGPDVRFEVGGGLALGTADAVRLAGGGRFDALNPSATVMTGGTPEALVFATDRPAAVVVHNVTLLPSLGRSVSIAGGDVTIEAAGSLFAGEGGRVGVLSVASSGEAALESGDSVLPAAFDPAAGPFARMGAVSVTGGATILSTDGGVRVTAGSLLLRDSGQIKSFASELATRPATIDVAASAAVEVVGERSAIVGSSFSGESPLVRIVGGSVAVSDAGVIESTGDSQGGAVAVRATADVSVGGGGRIRSSGGNGGPVDVAALGRVQVTGDGSVVESTTFFSGSSSTVRVSGGSVDVVSGGLIESRGTVRADSVTIASPGQVLVDGSGSGRQTAVRVSGPTTPGTAGLVVDAGQLRIRGGGLVAAESFAPEPGGNVRVTARAVEVSGPRSALSADSFQQGAAGTIDLRADSLEVLDGGAVSASNFRGTVAGGSIAISAARVTLDRGGSIAATGGGGLAEDLVLSTEFVSSSADESFLTADLFLVSPNSVRVQIDRSLSDSNYVDGGRAGDFETFAISPLTPLARFVARDLNGDWRLEVRPGPIPPLVNEGIPILNAWSLSLGDTEIGRSDARVSGRTLDSTLSIRNAATGLTPGRGGDIAMRTRELTVSGGSSIAAGTVGTGEAGNVNIDAEKVLVRDAGSVIQSASGSLGELIRPEERNGVGGAGSVRVAAAESIRVDGGGAVSVRSDTAGAGSVSLLSNGTIELFGGRFTPTPDTARASLVAAAATLSPDPDGTRVTAEALNGSGGNITLQAGRVVHVQDALVTAQALDAGGARIGVDAPLFVLDRSVMNGRAAGADVPVNISADVFIRSSDSRIESDVVTAPVEVDIAGSLARLPGNLTAAGAQLQEQCGARLDSPISTFVTTGRGGAALAPGGWAADFRLAGRR